MAVFGHVSISQEFKSQTGDTTSTECFAWSNRVWKPTERGRCNLPFMGRTRSSGMFSTSTMLKVTRAFHNTASKYYSTYRRKPRATGGISDLYCISEVKLPELDTIFSSRRGYFRLVLLYYPHTSSVPYRQFLLQFSSVMPSSSSPHTFTDEKISATNTAKQQSRAKMAMHFCWDCEVSETHAHTKKIHIMHIHILNSSLSGYRVLFVTKLCFVWYCAHTLLLPFICHVHCCFQLSVFFVFVLSKISITLTHALFIVFLV